jgi:hypothetical protein
MKLKERGYGSKLLQFFEETEEKMLKCLSFNFHWRNLENFIEKMVM